MGQDADRIENVIKSVFNKINEDANPTIDEIVKAWKEAAGEKAARHTRPASLRKKRLVINVDCSSWLYELTLKKKDLLSALQKKAGEDKIKELQFRIGEV
ncbi:MAG: DUF721 domain-containing protein [Candidatus Omnitrophica bacterium]|nr:DUF721 domain-containing protein [Candidatus Omnitrophota bacterium]